MQTGDTVRIVSPSAPLLGFWYPALMAQEVRRGRMKAQVLLGHPVLICRDHAGRVSALRNICPHRAMPLSFGNFDGERVECSYHGWQFDMEGRCRHIPALTSNSPIVPDKISVTSYPCSERDGYIWVYVPDPLDRASPPEAPHLPVLSEKYQLLHIAAQLQCTVDDGIIGLMDPAHGPFVHNSAWWRSRGSIHEKAKIFEPLPTGFRMKAHSPSRNSGLYKLLGLAAGLLPQAVAVFHTAQQMMVYGIWLNLILCFFNLIPVPPLDGSHLLYHALPPRAGAWYRGLNRFGYLPIFVLLFVFRPVMLILLAPASLGMDYLMRIISPYSVGL